MKKKIVDNSRDLFRILTCKISRKYFTLCTLNTDVNSIMCLVRLTLTGLLKILKTTNTNV